MTKSRRPRRLNFNLLAAIDAILSARTLSEAAKSSHLTSPALSTALKKARAHFGDVLILYRGGESELTALGAKLRPRVKAALQAARESFDYELTFDPATTTRTITLMANDAFEFVYLSKVFRQLAIEAPRAEIRFARFDQRPVEEIFLDDVDVVITTGHFLHPQFASAALFTDTLSCLVSSTHPDIAQSMTVEQYMSASHATTFLPTDRPIPPLVEALGATHHIALRVPSHSALPAFIVGTPLVATTLTRLAKEFSEMLPLRVVPVPLPMPALEVIAMWKPHRTEEPMMQWLIDRLQSIGRSI